jgi:hypothetical protein
VFRDKASCRTLVDVIISPPSFTADDLEVKSSDPREPLLWIVYGLCRNDEVRANLKATGILPPLYSLVVAASGSMRDITIAVLGAFAVDRMYIASSSAMRTCVVVSMLIVRVCVMCGVVNTAATQTEIAEHLAVAVAAS